MHRNVFFAAALRLSGVVAMVGHTEFPTPTPTPTLMPRADHTENLDLPTFTIDSIDRYVVTKRADADPEPTGDKLQIYPTGIFDDFPKDGVTVSFGPDLRKRIGDTAGSNCQSEGSACRDRLLPVVQNTDMNMHAKRFILVTSFLVGEIISFITTELLVAAAVGGVAGAVVAVKYNYNDMDQMQSIGEANTNTIAIQHGPDAAPTTVTIPAPPPPATPTADGLITIETMTVDSGDHKVGDVVFHIPEVNRARMQDILHMVGLDTVSTACAGQDLLAGSKPQSRIRNRDQAAWDTCVQTIENFIPDFVTSAPQDMLQVAAKNFPSQPLPGQNIGFPIPNLKLDDIPAAISTYRMLRTNIPKTGVKVQPKPGPPVTNIHLPSLFLSAFALTVVTHAIAAGGQVALDLWVSSADLAEIKKEEFLCPEDILCIEDACKAQKEDTVIKLRDTFCVEPKNQGCPCTPVFFPDHTEVPKGYMDGQYDWLQELVKLSAGPEFETKCEGEFQKDASLSTGIRDKIKEMCKNHKNLKDGADLNNLPLQGDRMWQEVITEKGSKTWSMNWVVEKDKNDTCDFDCETVFNAFAGSSDCVKNDGLYREGHIETDCGKAGYLIYLHS